MSKRKRKALRQNRIYTNIPGNNNCSINDEWIPVIKELEEAERLAAAAEGEEEPESGEPGTDAPNKKGNKKNQKKKKTNAQRKANQKKPNQVALILPFMGSFLLKVKQMNAFGCLIYFWGVDAFILLLILASNVIIYYLFENPLSKSLIFEFFPRFI